jgi:hypothetical protein
MSDNSLVVIIFAFILGCMCKNMMKQTCGQRLVEGTNNDDKMGFYSDVDENNRIIDYGYWPTVNDVSDNIVVPDTIMTRGSNNYNSDKRTKPSRFFKEIV